MKGFGSGNLSRVLTGEGSDQREALDEIEIRIWEPLPCTHGRGAMSAEAL